MYTYTPICWCIPDDSVCSTQMERGQGDDILGLTKIIQITRSSIYSRFSCLTHQHYSLPILLGVYSDAIPKDWKSLTLEPLLTPHGFKREMKWGERILTIYTCRPCQHSESPLLYLTTFAHSTVDQKTVVQHDRWNFWTLQYNHLSHAIYSSMRSVLKYLSAFAFREPFCDGFDTLHGRLYWNFSKSQHHTQTTTIRISSIHECTFTKYQVIPPAIQILCNDPKPTIPHICMWVWYILQAKRHCGSIHLENCFNIFFKIWGDCGGAAGSLREQTKLPEASSLRQNLSELDRLLHSFRQHNYEIRAHDDSSTNIDWN